MIKNLLKNLFKKEIFGDLVEKINSFEPEFEKLTNEELKNKSLSLKKIATSLNLNEILPEAFALCREAAKRNLNQRHFDVQLIGGIALHQGKIAEMATGEGKTLTATLPAYLNALTAKGVHIITVNDYLARRDAVWMGQIYDSLGLTVGCLTHENAYIYDQNFQKDAVQEDKDRDILGGFKIFYDFLRPISKKKVYQCDILYGTNHEFGFDYLRDNLSYDKNSQVQKKEFYYAIIDEIDSILIDEARTPLIISAPNAESSQYYKVFSKIVSYLEKDKDYLVDEKAKSVAITDEGITKVEKNLNIHNLYSPENLKLAHYLEESLKAKALFFKDKHYIVESAPAGGNEIVIIDEFTGRKMRGRRYSGGLHQALEAKENVFVKEESKTMAKITLQNYFRLYEKLSGMTGTAATSAEEFHKVYDLEVSRVPTNKPMIRKDQPDLIYKNFKAKYSAVIEEIKKRRFLGQPVLIGTASIEHNELLSYLLKQAGVPHNVLNAKNHEAEGATIAQAGKIGAVTVATNMAGRGVDIVFGGNPSNPEEAQKVRELGGLYVIGTERHEARRIDNQLRGRSGRQGDPGESRFFLSLEDDLLRIFGGEKIKNLMETFNLPDDQPIESRLVSKLVNEAQKKIEGLNFDARKHLLEYDDVLNKQRAAFYEKRQKILYENPQALIMLDTLWMNHLENMEALLEAVRLRAYGQHDPLVEYRRESHLLFKQLLNDFEKWLEENENKLSISNSQFSINNQFPISKQNENLKLKIENSRLKIGRNDPCPCGAKKPDGTSIKYKHCHGA
ncbi:preprotein translocase subunit SecA [Candidatus Wolfebacteria bacterium]|nr:preprotein translocase subunit SecA [Candidatus Wolfebacteria bacterium]